MKIEKVKSRYGNHTISYDDSQEAKDKLYNMMLNFFKTHEVYNGESIQQCDVPQINSPELLSEIADEIFKFDAKWDG